MLQIGKKYLVAEPEKAHILSHPAEVEIIEEKDGMFRGDNHYWYFSDGKYRSEPGMSDLDAIHLIADAGK